MSLKNPVTPPGNDPGAVRLVAQRLTVLYYSDVINCMSEVEERFLEFSRRSLLH